MECGRSILGARGSRYQVFAACLAYYLNAVLTGELQPKEYN